MFRQIVTNLGLLLVMASWVNADSPAEASAQDTKKMLQNSFVETAQKGIKLSGYVDMGYSYNFTGTSPTSANVDGRFGTDTAQRGDFNLYAVKIALEKALTSPKTSPKPVFVRTSSWVRTATTSTIAPM